MTGERHTERAYERMLAAVESGSIDAIVTWHNDRLHRSPRELEAFIDLVERSRVRLAVSRRSGVGANEGSGPSATGTSSG